MDEYRTESHGLPYMVLDKNAVVIAADMPDGIGFDVGDMASFSVKLLNSVRRSDRGVFYEFCAKDFVKSKFNAEIFRIVSFPLCKLMYLEKNIINGLTVNIAYFANSITDFVPLISPVRAQYQNASGRSIDDVFAAVGEKYAEEYLTPEAFAISSKYPALFSDLESGAASRKNCCLWECAGRIADNIKNNALFSDISFNIENRSADKESASGIYRIAINAFTHAFCSTSYILCAMSDERKINVLFDCCKSGAVVHFSAHARDCEKLPDSVSLCVIAEEYPALSAIAEVLSLINAASGYNSSFSLNKDNGIIEFTYDLSMSRWTDGFRYYDPYSVIGEAAEEALDMIEKLISA